MTNDEFRAEMSKASRDNDLCWVMHDNGAQIAVGMDSSKGVAILHPNREVPMAEVYAMPDIARSLPIHHTSLASPGIKGVAYIPEEGE